MYTMGLLQMHAFARNREGSGHFPYGTDLIIEELQQLRDSGVTFLLSLHHEKVHMACTAV